MRVFTRVVMAATGAKPVERAITRTRAGRAVASRYVAGDSLEEATPIARRIQDEGLTISLDLLGEAVGERADVARATGEYLDCLGLIRAETLDANISVKLTQLGLAIDPDLAREALERLAVEAASAGTTVTVDMEDSRYTAATIDLYSAVQDRHANLGLCLQACLRRTPDDLERLIPLGGHIRLCKGAYAEPEEIAFQSDDEVDAAFARLLTMLMQAEGVRPAVATHDPGLIELARSLGEKRESGFEYQMLYGVRNDEQRRLSSSGADVRVYLPFGSSWYPYLTRRMAERPANVLFFLRSLLGR